MQLVVARHLPVAAGLEAELGHEQSAELFVPAKEPGRRAGTACKADAWGLFDHVHAGPIGCEYRPRAGTSAELGWFEPNRALQN